MSDLSKRILSAIEKSGKSQKEVASEIGITAVTMNRYANGERNPKIFVIPKLAKACGVSEKWLLTGKEPFDSHIEMIIDYITDGTDFQYSDNHGVLVRCRDCKYYWSEYMTCTKHEMNQARATALKAEKDFYCGYGTRRAKDDK